jgi:hypothetical protein
LGKELEEGIWSAQDIALLGSVVLGMAGILQKAYCTCYNLK